MMRELENHTDSLSTFLFDGLPARVGPYFTTARDDETRRKCAVLALTMMLFMVYNSFLIASGLVYGGGYFFTFMRTLAIILLASQSLLLYLFHRTHRLFTIGTLFVIDVDLGTLAVCFNYGAVGEYMMWWLYVPILLFYIRGSRAGLFGLLFIIGQLTVFFPLSSYVFQPNDEELKLLPAAHKWFVMLMTYLIVGITAFVHETSSAKGLVKLKRREELNEQLQEAAQAKTGLLLNISHELRTPLHGIIASAAMLLDSTAVEGSFRESLEAIKVCGEHMLELVNNVLDIGKIEAKKLSLESIPFRPMDELDAVMKIFASQAEQKNIKLKKAVSMDHPTRLGDPLRFRQVLFNLLSNAIKFTDDGGQVFVRMSDDGEDVRTEVEDTGAGIPKEQLSTLFENFSQGDVSIARRYGGSGLGLALSQRICESMGGHIHCSSSLGRGSKFWFTVGMCIHSTDVMPFLDLETQSQPCEPSEALRQKKILFVEDNTINQKVGMRMLQALGCHAKLASNGEECLAAMREESFDLVLMDCQMPVMDGFSATRMLREREEALWMGHPVHTPVVAITASATAESRQQCIDAGMDDWMPKPFDKNKLCRVLNRWLGDKPHHGTDDGHTNQKTKEDPKRNDKSHVRGKKDRGGTPVKEEEATEEAMERGSSKKQKEKEEGEIAPVGEGREEEEKATQVRMRHVPAGSRPGEAGQEDQNDTEEALM